MAGNSICRRKLFAHGCEKSNWGGKVGPRLRRAKVSPWIVFLERTMGELERLWWEGGWRDGGRTVGEFVQQAQHVARHSGPSGTPHLLCTSKILLSTTTLLAIHIYQPHSQFYMNFTLQCRLYIERACYLRQPQSASQSPFIPIT